MSKMHTEKMQGVQGRRAYDFCLFMCWYECV